MHQLDPNIICVCKGCHRARLVRVEEKLDAAEEQRALDMQEIRDLFGKQDEDTIERIRTLMLGDAKPLRDLVAKTQGGADKTPGSAPPAPPAGP